MKKFFILLLFFIYMPLVCADDIDARLDWSERVTMSTSVSGVVSLVKVVPGQKISKGDLLLRLDQSVYEANLLDAEQDLKSAELSMQEGEKEWERAQELYERTVLSDHELATARVLYAKRQADYQRAASNLAQVKYNLKYSEIRAPFNGVVVDASVSVGQTVIQNMQSEPMLVLANNVQMIAETFVSAKQARALSQSSKVSVKLGGNNIVGVVSSIGVEPVDGKYLLRVKFDSNGKMFRKGEKAEIVLP